MTSRARLGSYLLWPSARNVWGDRPTIPAAWASVGSCLASSGRQLGPSAPFLVDLAGGRVLALAAIVHLRSYLRALRAQNVLSFSDGSDVAYHGKRTGIVAILVQ